MANALKVPSSAALLALPFGLIFLDLPQRQAASSRLAPVPRPDVSAGRGNSFDIGYLTAAVHRRGRPMSWPGGMLPRGRRPQLLPPREIRRGLPRPPAVHAALDCLQDAACCTRPLANDRRLLQPRAIRLTPTSPSAPGSGKARQLMFPRSFTLAVSAPVGSNGLKRRSMRRTVHSGDNVAERARGWIGHVRPAEAGSEAAWHKSVKGPRDQPRRPPIVAVSALSCSWLATAPTEGATAASSPR